MKVLITGAAGFMGPFLTRHAMTAGASAILGIDSVAAGREWPGAPFQKCDVRDEARLLSVISEFQPDRVFHLAAQSYPTVSLQKPRETVESNISGTVNLYESLRTAGLAPMVVVACSSAEYGPVAAKDLPVKEEHPLRPLHPYGVSKVAQDLLAAQYFANYGMPSVRIRIFNTTGPSKLGDVCSDLIRRAVEIEMGLQRPSLMMGNLTTRRAIIDVRDMIRGLWIASEQCEPGEVYNVGANQIYSVTELIEAVRPHIKVAFQVVQHPDLVRTCDEPVIAGDTTKFHDRTGWKPEIGLAKTLGDMLEWWRHRLAEAPVAQSSLIGADRL